MSRDAKRRIGDWAVAVAVALIAIVVAWGATEVRRQGEVNDRQSEIIDVLDQALTDEQSNAEAAGIEPVAPDADDLIDDPEYEPQPGPSGPPGPGPTDAQIAAEVADYFEAHPLLGQPTAAELAAAVASYLTDHPAEVPDDRVYEAIAAYLVANPPPAGPPGEDGTDGQDGTDGAQGDPGPPPTRAEIQAEVEAYFEEHPIEEPCDEPGFDYAVHEVVVVDGPPLELIGCFETESTE